MADASRDRLLTPAFALLWAITFVTFFAAFMMFPTVPLRLREMGASLAESGRFLAVFTAGSAVGALFTGPLGDRVGSRRMVVCTALLFALFVLAYGLVPHRGWIYALAPLHGFVWSGLLTATMALLGGVLPLERRADGMSLYGLASPAGVVLGPLAGLELQQRWPFLALCAGIFAGFVLLGLLAFTLPRDPAHAEHRPFFRLPDRVMTGPCAVLFATALGYGSLGPYTAQEGKLLGFPVFAGFSTASAFLSCMGLGMVAMRVVMARAGFGKRPVRMVPVMLLGSAGSLALLALLPGGLGRHALAGLLYGAGYSMVHTLVSTQVLELVPPERRGAAFGATLFSFDAGIGLGSFLLGLVIGHAGFRAGWAGAALATLAAVPLARRLAQSPKVSS